MMTIERTATVPATRALPTEAAKRVKIGVVIPCFRVRRHILDVLTSITRIVDLIIVVDDCCPEGTGTLVAAHCVDPRVRVVWHRENQGVGGATITGYREALQEGCDVVVKLDGDGQMDAARLAHLVAPIARGDADYTKGNRFHDSRYLARMPFLRVFGNGLLSFVNKMVTGYWNIMDPTNGYTAAHRDTLRQLALDKIERRYFFESDMLFRLSLQRAVVRDVPMPAIYAEECSNMHIGRVAVAFPLKYVTRFAKRIVYAYFVRDFNAGTVWILAALVCLTFGLVFGFYHWWLSALEQRTATAGTVMLAALPVVVGFQSLMAAVTFDIHNTPSDCRLSEEPGDVCSGGDRDRA